MPGRPFHDYWQNGHFQIIEKKNGKKSALCMVCNRELVNSARKRLMIHRKNCPTVSDTLKKENDQAPQMAMVKSEEVMIKKEHALQLPNKTEYQPGKIIAAKQVNLENDSDDEEDYESIQIYFDNSTEEISVDELVLQDPDADASTTNDLQQSSDETGALRKRSSSPLPVSPAKRVKSLQTALVAAQTPTGTINLDTIHTSFTEFFIASAVPFKDLNSPYLKRFISNLNRSYKPPTLKQLTTTYLDKVQEKHTKNDEWSKEQDVTLLLSGWKDFTETSKCVVACLYKKAPNESKESRIFLNTWDLDTDYIVDDEEIQRRIVEESCKTAREQHNARVYAVVSDHPQLNVGLLHEATLQHSLCHSFLAGRLAEDIVNHDYAKLINQIHQELLREGFEPKILDRDGTRLVLSTMGRWCTYRDSFQSFIVCNQIVRNLVEESKLSISSLVHENIFDEDLLHKIGEYVDILEPICELIYLAQKKNSTHAEVSEKWLQLSVPSEYHKQLEQRRNLALTPLTLTANFLHPVYRGRKLNAAQTDAVDNFLLESLDSPGLDQLLLFKRTENVFRILANKKITSYDTFWTMAERKCPELAACAKRLLCIPASVSYVDKIFSKWLSVNSDLRNLMGMELYRKLTRVHFQLNLTDREM